MERQGAIAEIIVEVLRGLQQRLLHDVGRVDAHGQATIQPHRHHPDQPVVMPDQELLARPVVALRCPCDQLFGIGLELAHHR